MAVAVNCLSHNNDLYGFNLVEGGGEDARAYNCVATNNSIGFIDGGGDPDCINCLSTDNGTDFWAAFGGNTDYNASEDGTAVGGNSNANISMVNLYENSGNDDFHIQAIATTDVRNAGTDLSGDGFYAFDDDVNDGTMGGSVTGTLFDTWDIGLNEPEPAGAPAAGGRKTVPQIIQNKNTNKRIYASLSKESKISKEAIYK